MLISQCHPTDSTDVLKSRQVYLEIFLECTKSENKTTGNWLWTDEGNQSMTLPPCQVIFFKLI